MQKRQGEQHMINCRTKKFMLVVLSVMLAFSVAVLALIRPVEATGAIIRMEESASVVSDTSTAGITFSAYVSNTVALDDDTIAGVFVVKGDVEVSSLTAGTESVIDLRDIEFDSTKDTQDEKAFNVSLTDIADAELATTFTARAYVLDDGVYKYSDNVCKASVSQVASEELAEIKQQDKVLMGYVDAANAVVKLNGQVLSPDEEIITLDVSATTKLDFTVEPANIKPTIMVNHKNLSVEGNSVKTSKIHVLANDPQYVTVDVGNYSWLINLYTSTKWIEDDVSGNVLATFDKEEYIGAVLDGNTAGAGQNNSMTWLDPATALAETGRESGMLKVDAGAWDVISYEFNTPIQLSEISKGIYVKFKMPAEFEYDGTDGEVDLDANNGIMYVGVNGTQKALTPYAKPSWVGSSVYKAMNGEWNVWRITKTDIIKYFNNVSQIERIAFMPVYKSCVYYIDEIGIIEDYVDTTVESGVIVDFDEEKSIEAIQNGTDVGDGMNASVTWLSPAEAMAETGRESGMIKVTDAGGWKCFIYKFNTPISASDNGGIYIKFKMPAEFEWDADDENNGIMYFSVNSCNSVALANTKSRTYKAGNGEWNVLAVTNYDLQKTFGVTQVEKFCFMPVYKGCTYYVDEIGVFDEEADVINSFDGKSAVQDKLIYNKFNEGWHTVQPGDADYPTNIGATSGLLVIPANSAHGCGANLHVANPIKTSTVSKIKIRIYVPLNASYNNANLALSIGFNETINQNTFEVSDQKFFLKRGQWNEIEVSVSGFTSEYITTMGMFRRMFDASAEAYKGEGNWYVDYVKVIPKA